VINAIKEINCFTALFYTDPILFIALHRGLLRRKFAKMFDTHKTRMIELSYVVTICEAVSIEYRNVTDRRTDRRTDGQTDGRTDEIAISVVGLDCDKRGNSWNVCSATKM